MKLAQLDNEAAMLGVVLKGNMETVLPVAVGVAPEQDSLRVVAHETRGHCAEDRYGALMAANRRFHNYVDAELRTTGLPVAQEVAEGVQRH